MSSHEVTVFIHLMQFERQKRQAFILGEKKQQTTHKNGSSQCFPQWNVEAAAAVKS